MKTLEKINYVNLKSEVIVTDPCYTVEQGEIVKSVLSGKYEPLLNYEDNRVASFILIHKDYSLDDLKNFNQELISDFIGVDSGQCGVFNLDYFTDNYKDDDYNNTSSFYRRVCDMTVSEDMCGIIDDNGFCSSSGWGDGLYSAYAYRERNGYIVAIELVFMEESED